MIAHRLRTLDDATALDLLAAMARAHRLASGPPRDPTELRAALAAAFGEHPTRMLPGPSTAPPDPTLPRAVSAHHSPPAPVTEADVARAALVLAAEDPEIAAALESLLDHGPGVRAVLGTGSWRDLVTCAAVSLLQSRFKLAVEVPGALSFHIEKQPASDSAALALARALQGALPPAPTAVSPPGLSPVPAPATGTDLPPAPHPQSTSTTSVFVARAPEDRELAAALRRHLAPLLQSGALTWWSEDDLKAGWPTAATIESRLDSAAVLLIFVSAHLLHSAPLHAQWTRALDRHRRGAAPVVPILLRPCDWERTALGELLPLPRDRRPVTTWPRQDDAWLSIVHDLVALLPPAAP